MPRFFFFLQNGGFELGFHRFPPGVELLAEVLPQILCRHEKDGRRGEVVGKSSGGFVFFFYFCVIIVIYRYDIIMFMFMF